MQISVIEKPYEIANSGWDFKLCEILSKADNDNRLALEAFRRAKDGGEKAEILYELRLSFPAYARDATAAVFHPCR